MKLVIIELSCFLKNSYKKFIPQNHVDATNIYLTDAWNNHIFTFLNS